MKKTIKMTSLVMGAAMLVSTLAACNPSGGGDANTLVIKAYQGGYGSAVYEELQRAWNAKADTGEETFRIRIVGDPMLSQGFNATIQGLNYGDSNNVADIYIIDSISTYTSSRLKYTEGSYKGKYYFEDITDVVTDEKYAWDGKTIAEKVDPAMVRNLRINRETGNIDENGAFTYLPYSGGYTGFVYYRSFLESFAQELTSLGCTQFVDGKFVEPQTMQEFWDLQKYISRLSTNQISEDNKVYTFVNDLSSSSGYFPYMADALLMQMMGEEEYYKHINFEGVTDVETYNQNFDNVDYAYEAMYDNIYKLGGDPASKSQTAFKNYDNPTLTWNGLLIQKKGFFTVNGDWSYNEARGYLADNDVLDMMVVPLACDVETGKVIAKATPKAEAGLSDGADNDKYFKVETSKVDSSVIPEGEEDDQYIYFKKIVNANIGDVNLMIPTACKDVDGAKRFVSWMYSEEAGNIYTKYTGAVQPFNYTVSEETYNSLSQFQKKTVYLKNNATTLNTGFNLYTDVAVRAILPLNGGLSDRWIYDIFAHAAASHEAMMNTRKNAGKAKAGNIQAEIDIVELTIKNNNW